MLFLAVLSKGVLCGLLIAEHFVFCNSNARICVGCAARVLFAWTNESTVVVCHIIYFIASVIGWLLGMRRNKLA